MATSSKKGKNTKVSKKRKYNKLSKAQRKAIRKIYKRSAQYKRKYRGRVINVAEDKELSTKSRYKQRVTRHQQKLINKRFKNGYSPFIKNKTDQLQLNGKYEVDKCKWIWRCSNDLTFIMEAFSAFPTLTGAPGGSNTLGNYYLNTGDQSIYFGEFKYKYEILNPTEIDMNLVIYDIVYKQDTQGGAVTNQYFESWTNKSGDIVSPNTTYPEYNTNTYQDNPIALINNGTYGIETNQSHNGSIIIADNNEVPLDSINCKPTQSYPFNIYCKIVRKHTYRLQPGATMTHTFIHRPKFMFNRGYFYKYDYSIQQSIASQKQKAVKDMTSGCLFKVWGQLGQSGSTSSADKQQVLAQSGHLAIKEYFTAKWYAMNERSSYIFNDETNKWNASTSDIDKLETINNATVKTVESMNLDNTDNNVPPNT